MKKLVLRIGSFVIMAVSTPAAAQSLDDILDTLKDIDMNVADTGFKIDEEKYAFGATKEIAKDTTVDIGIGAKYNVSPENRLSKNYGTAGSQTNMLEQDNSPLGATPMVGINFGYKF